MSARATLAATLVLVTTVLPAALFVAGPASATNFAVLLSGSQNATTAPTSIAIGASGSGVAAWTVNEPPYYAIYASRLVEGKGWARALPLSPAASYAFMPDTAATEDGFLAVAWHDDLTLRAGAAIFDPASGWSQPTALNLSDLGSRDGRVAATGPGAFAFVWRESDGSRWEPIYQTWNASAGWGLPLPMSNTTAYASFADVASDGRGSVTVAWAEQGGPGNEIFAVSGSVGALVPSSRALLWSMSDRLFSIVVEEGPGGRAAVAWTWEIGSFPVAGYPESAAFIAIREAGQAAWGSAEIVSNATSSGYLGRAFVAVVPEVGDEVLVLFDDAQTAGADARIRSAGPVSGWPDAVPLGTGTFLSTPGAVAHPDGSATVVWPALVGSISQIDGAFYHAATGWAQAADIVADTLRPYSLTLAATPADGAFALFIDSDGGAYAAPIDDMAAPSLTIAEPAAGAAFSDASCWVRVSSPWAARVEVNGVLAALGPDGHWGALVPLRPGANTLAAVASDAAGNSATASVVVTFEDPVPGIAADLNATIEALANATQTIDELGASLETTSAALNAMELALNQTADELGRVKVQLPWLEANASAAAANVTILKGEITALEADYETQRARASALESQQRDTEATLANATANSAALASQVATLSLLSAASLLGAAAAVGLSLLRGRGGGGGGGELRASDPRPAVQGAAEAGKGGPDKGEAPPPAGHGG